MGSEDTGVPYFPGGGVEEGGKGDSRVIDYLDVAILCSALCFGVVVGGFRTDVLRC